MGVRPPDPADRATAERVRPRPPDRPVRRQTAGGPTRRGHDDPGPHPGGCQGSARHNPFRTLPKIPGTRRPSRSSCWSALYRRSHAMGRTTAAGCSNEVQKGIFILFQPQSTPVFGLRCRKKDGRRPFYLYSRSASARYTLTAGSNHRSPLYPTSRTSCQYSGGRLPRRRRADQHCSIPSFRAFRGGLSLLRSGSLPESPRA